MCILEVILDYSKDANQKNRRNAVSKTKKSRNRVVTIIFRVVVSLAIISIFAAGGVAFGAYLGIIDSISTIDYMTIHIPTYETSIVFDRYGNEIDRFWAGENREFVSLEQIPLHLQNAFIAIEDQRFFEHNGVDLRGTMRAIHVTLTTERQEGGSTITQQLVKNNIMGIHTNTTETKLQEIFLALRLEAGLASQLGSTEAAKRRILELYLNTINLGGQLHGVQSAALFYFNKDVEEITLSEAAVLAAITQSPGYFNPARNPQNNRLRQVTVLNRMLAQGLITEAEFTYAYNDPVFERISEFTIQREEQGNIRSYFMDHLFNVLVEDLIEAGFAATRTDASQIIHNHGLRIHTTKNPYIQAIIEEVYLDDSFFPAQEFEISMEYHISFTDTLTDEIVHRSFLHITVPNLERAYEWRDEMRAYLLGEHGEFIIDRFITTPQPQSAFVVLDHNTGQVHGLVGGRGEKRANLAFNRATEGRRHPGSVFKMIASYAPAFDLGLLAPSTILVDQPFVITSGGQEWAPENWQNHFRGNNTAGGITVRRAVADSFNRVAAMTTYHLVGVDRAFQYVLNFGFDLPDTDRIPSIALGGLTEGVTQLELASAFGAIANGGILIEPTFYTRIYDHRGDLLLEANPQERQVMRPEAAYLLTSTMQDVLTQGTGGMARLNGNMAVAGKTGTSQGTRDINFVGYTPHFTASVWLGHDQPRDLRTPTGNPHLRIWSTIMNRVHEDLEVIPRFERPSGIITEQVNTATGMIAVPGVGNIRTEIFDRNFRPNHGGPIRFDVLTGRPIIEEIPEHYVVIGTDPTTGEPIMGPPQTYTYNYYEQFYQYFNDDTDDNVVEEPLIEQPHVYELVVDDFVNPDFSDQQVANPEPPVTWPPVQNAPPIVEPDPEPPTVPPINNEGQITLPGGNVPTIPDEAPIITELPVMPDLPPVEEFTENVIG